MEKDEAIKTFLLLAIENISRAYEFLYECAPDFDFPKPTPHKKTIGKTIYGFFGSDPPNIDNLIDKERNTDFKADTKEESQMPPKITFQDGSFRTPKGRKCLSYRFMHNGKQLTVTGRTNDECYQKRLEIISGKKSIKQVKQFTVGEYAIDFYNRYQKDKSGGINQKLKEARIKELQDSSLGKKLLNKATADDIQEYLNSYNDYPNKQDKIHIFVRGMFKKAFGTGKIKSNPCEEVNYEKHRSKHYPVIQFSEQRLIFENETSDVYRKIFMILCCTGLRISEFYNSLPYIDFLNHAFIIEDEDKKTKKHKGIIPFLPDLITETDRDNFLKLKRNSVQNHFKELFRKLNLKVCVHSFRVTFISCCNYLRYNPLKIKELARHSDIRMTMDTYAKLLRPGEPTPILEYLKRLKEVIDP